MIPIRRALALLFLVAALGGGALWAVGEGRVQGTVTDETGAPVQGVKVTVTRPNTNFKQEKTTDAKGRFSVLLLDATQEYRIKLEKPGHVVFEDVLKAQIGEITRVSYLLPKQAAVEAESAEMAQAEGAGKAVDTFNAGVLAFQGGDRATAIAKFQEAAELDPKLADAHGALAEVYLAEGKYPEAAASAEAYLALDPEQKARGLRARYDAYRAMGEKEKSAQALEALIAGDPGRETAIRIFNEGAEASRGGKLEDAVKQLQRAIEVDPGLEPAYAALGNIYLSQKKYKEALEVADKQIGLDAKSLEGLTIRYEAYRGLGDEAKAKETFAAMSAADPGGTSEGFFKQGVALFNANNFAQAKVAFERVLTVEPGHAKAHYMLGLVHANANETAKAKDYLEKFLKLAPNDPDAPAAKEMLEYLK